MSLIWHGIRVPEKTSRLAEGSVKINKHPPKKNSIYRKNTTKVTPNPNLLDFITRTLTKNSSHTRMLLLGILKLHKAQNCKAKLYVREMKSHFTNLYATITATLFIKSKPASNSDISH